jgi:PAS domain S-box-containing protein
MDMTIREGGNSDLLYQRLIEEIQDYAIILLDKNGFIRNWNKGAEKIKMYAPKDILGKHFSIFYLQEDLDQNLPSKLIRQAELTGAASQEGWRKRKDGSKFWGSITITAIHDDEGGIIGFSKVTRDLTDKKLAEDKLRISEERYHQMIAEIQDYAIILLDENGIIENWNIGAEKIKGYTSDEAIGRRFEIFYTPEDRAQNMPDKLLAEARNTGKALQEGWRVRKDGSKFWGTIVITALHGRDNRVIGFTKVTRDLTARKIAEDRLLAYTAELELQNSELEQFAYVASHDLQEPLRKIQTFTDLIQQNFHDTAFIERYLIKLNASARRMGLLVKSLLNYSRVAQEITEISRVDLNMVLAQVREDFELLISEKNATIHGDRLPTVMGNHTQLVQLFSNLIGNSLKFSHGDTVINISSVSLEKAEIPDAPTYLPDGLYVQIDFVDNGIGFEQQYEKKIFSLFQRLHSKEEYSGTGIGLALCKKIVENHHGVITALSELGKGAKFSVYLCLQANSSLG